MIDIQDIEKNIHTSRWLTPLNVKEEREKFLAHPTKNPVFVYQEIPSGILKESLRQLGDVKLDESLSVAEQWFTTRRVEELELEIQLLLSRGKEELTQISCQLYQCTFPGISLQSAEKDAAQNIKFEQQETIELTQIVEGIRSYLAGYNILDWDVSLSSETDFYFRVKPTQKKILISQRFNFDFCDFDNVLAHEIDGHVLRAINAQKQTSAWLKKPTPFYIKTEEGLASFLGDYCSTTANISRKHHALKYLAGHLGLTSSFKEIFEFLVDSGFTPDLAFQRTLRLKRGFEDTSVPGCFAKEAMYYEGMLEVKKYLDDGGDAKKLYSAKVGLRDLKFSEVPIEVLVPQRLTTYLASSSRNSFEKSFSS